MKKYYKYPLILILLLLLSSCAIHKKNKSYTYTKREEQQIEKTEVEGKLKGKSKKVLEEAFEWLDTPYTYGRQDKNLATDCSGFVMRVFEIAIDCKLPRNSAKQAEFCESIKHGDIKAGDLVFFITSGSKINHVGIMIDKEKFIHASSSKGVIVSDMKSNYYKTHFKQYGRVPCMKK